LDASFQKIDAYETELRRALNWISQELTSVAPCPNMTLETKREKLRSSKESCEKLLAQLKDERTKIKKAFETSNLRAVAEVAETFGALLTR
jgi:hypothetical protein